MKQTSSALTFLMAHYRAIFQQAYVKDLASAVLLVAGLSVGQAQEQTINWGTVDSPLVDQTINGEVSIKDGGTKYAQNITVVEGGNLTVSHVADSSLNYSGDLKVQGGMLNVTNAVISGYVDTKTYPTINAAHGKVKVGTLTVEDGTVNLSANGSRIDVSAFNLIGGTVNIGGEDDSPDHIVNSQIYGGWGADPSESYVGGSAVINLNSDSLLATGQNLIVNGGTINFNGSKFNSAVLYGPKGKDQFMSLRDGTLNIHNGKFGSIQGTNLKVEGATINVENEGELSFTSRSVEKLSNAATIDMSAGALINKGTINIGIAGVEEENSTTFMATGGVINNQGTLNLYGATTLDGVTLINDNKVNVNQGHSLTFASDYDLSSGEGTINNQGKLVVAKGATLTIAKLADVGLDKKSDFSLEQGATLAFNQDAALTQEQVSYIGGSGQVSGTKLTFDVSQAGDTLTLGDNAYAAETVALTLAGNDFTLAADSSLSANELELDQAKSVALKGHLTLRGKQNLANAITVQEGGCLALDDQANYQLAKLTVQKNGLVTIDTYSNAQVDAFKADAGAQVGVIGNLTILGVAEAQTADEVGVSYADNTITVHSDGVLTLDGTALKYLITAAEPDAETAASSPHFVISDSLGALKMDGGKLVLNYNDANRTFNPSEIAELKSELFAAGTSGILSVGAAKLADLEVGPSGEVSLEALQNSNSAANGTTSHALDNATVVAKEDALLLTEKSSVGAIKVAGSGKTAQMEGDWTLNNAAHNTAGAGVFVANEHGEALSLSTTGDLTLANGGAIGQIKVTAPGKSVTITNLKADTAKNVTKLNGIANEQGTVKISGLTESSGNIIAKNLEVSSSLTAKGDTATPIEVKAESLKASADITVDSLTLVNAQDAALSSSISSGSHKLGTLSIGSNSAQQDGAEGKFAPQVTVNGDAKVEVAQLLGSAGAILNIGTDGKDGSSAELIAATTSLQGMTIVGDPEWDKASSLTSLGMISSNPKAQSADGVVQGNIVAARNNYTVIGMNEAEARQLMAKHQLSEHGTKSMLVVGQKLSLAQGSGLVVSGQTGKEAQQLLDGSVYLDKGATLYFTQDVAEVKKAEDKAAITFNHNDGKVTAAGGNIIVGGNLTTDATLKLFANADESAVTIADQNEGQGITIASENGVFTKTVTDGTELSNVKLDLAKDAYQRLALSQPVFAAAQKIAQDSSMQGEGVAFVRDAMGKGDGRAIEHASHLATFGGALQSSLMTAQSSADLIAERLGVAKASSALVAADNDNGVGLWLSSFYRRQESEGFKVDGRNYGTHIDLSGMSLGADYTLNNGVRVGAMVNLGSGEVEGQQTAQSVKNEFDYYSFGLYSGFTYDELSLGADVTYSATHNELSAGALKAETDVAVWALGVNAQYKFDLGVVDVAPHAGLRYHHIAMDDYTVKHQSKAISKLESSDLSVFSVPFGVTVSSDIELGSWTIKPALDLTLTANAGDTDLESKVVFTGANFGSRLNAELMDSFTYSGTLGVAATKDRFAVGMNFGYTGSSNTDEFGINANARYTF